MAAAVQLLLGAAGFAALFFNKQTPTNTNQMNPASHNPQRSTQHVTRRVQSRMLAASFTYQLINSGLELCVGLVERRRHRLKQHEWCRAMRQARRAQWAAGAWCLVRACGQFTRWLAGFAFACAGAGASFLMSKTPSPPAAFLLSKHVAPSRARPPPAPRTLAAP
jgi:hypothetical protein